MLTKPILNLILGLIQLKIDLCNDLALAFIKLGDIDTEFEVGLISIQTRQTINFYSDSFSNAIGKEFS